LRCSPALLLPLLLLACDKDKKKEGEADDTGQTADSTTPSDTDPDCDTGYLDDDGECVPAGCGTGTWGNLELDESTVYVDISAAENGDGSEAAPFTSIQAGLDTAGDADGGMVAVAAGSYLETLELGREHDGVHLAGRCMELIIIDASVGDEDTPGIDVDVKSSEVEVSGVTVSGSHSYGVLVGAGTMTFRDSKVVGSALFGVAAHQADWYETSLAVDSCVVSGNTGVGVYANDPDTMVTLRETTIQGTHLWKTMWGGFGIEVKGGANLTAETCEVSGNAVAGIFIDDSGTSVALHETTIRDTQQPETGKSGFGIEVHNGANLTAESCEVSENAVAGVFAGESDTTVTLRETNIQDTQPDEIWGLGYGVWVFGGASLEVESCQISGNTEVGVLAQDSGTAVTLRETNIRDTQPDKILGAGVGIQVQDGAILDAEGCEISGNMAAGVAAGDSGTTVTLRETTIQDTQTVKDRMGGVGIVVITGARLESEGCEIRGNTAAGVSAAHSGTSVSLRGGTAIEGTKPDKNGFGGYGIYVSDGASLDAEACELGENTAVGVVAVDSGTSVSLRDTRIASTKRGEVQTVGLGIAAQRLASIMATDIEVSSNEGPGIYLTEENTYLTCSGCVIRDNQFAGALVAWDATLDIADSFIEGTAEQENLGGGVGITQTPGLAALRP